MPKALHPSSFHCCQPQDPSHVFVLPSLLALCARLGARPLVFVCSRKLLERESYRSRGNKTRLRSLSFLSFTVGKGAGGSGSGGVGVVGCAMVVSSGSNSNCTLCCGNGSCCCWSCQVTRGTAVRLDVVVSACCASNTLCCGNGDRLLLWNRGCKTLCVVFRVFSNPP